MHKVVSSRSSLWSWCCLCGGSNFDHKEQIELVTVENSQKAQFPIPPESLESKYNELMPPRKSSFAFTKYESKFEIIPNELDEYSVAFNDLMANKDFSFQDLIVFLNELTFETILQIIRDKLPSLIAQFPPCYFDGQEGDQIQKGHLLWNELVAVDRDYSTGNFGGRGIGYYHKTPEQIQLGETLATYITDQGQRDSMEDAFYIGEFEVHGVKCEFIGGYDGHKGDGAAKKLADKEQGLHKTVESKLCRLSQEDFHKDGYAVSAITEAFESFQAELEQKDDSGSTACICLEIGDKRFVANVGDSRVVLIRQKNNKLSFRPLSYDHKAFLPEEFFRIINAGGQIFYFFDYDYHKYFNVTKESISFSNGVSITSQQISKKEAIGNKKVLVSTENGQSYELSKNEVYQMQYSQVTGRLDVQKVFYSSKKPSNENQAIPMLDPTRAFGNPNMRDVITTTPFVTVSEIKPGDKVVLATDGLWGMMSSRDVGQIIARQPKVYKNTGEPISEDEQAKSIISKLLIANQNKWKLGGLVRDNNIIIMLSH